MLLHDLRWWLAYTWPGRVVAALVTVVVLSAAGAGAWWTLGGPQRFETVVLDDRPVAAAPVPPTGPAPPVAAPEPAVVPEPVVARPPTVWLLFSTGTGALTADEAAWMRMPDGTRRSKDRLTDAMMLAIVDPDSHRTALLSIPRDTWINDRGQRINAVYAVDGLQALVDEVRELTGLPVHHVAGVNMRGFTRAVDAAGGVVVATDRPLKDDKSHLRELPAGCWRLDGPDALAYVRSRHTKTLRDGSWTYDRTASDFGRVERQREVLGSLWERARGPKLVTMAPTLLQVVGQDLTLDQGTDTGELVGFARAAAAVAAGTVESHTLPTYGRNIGGAAAQVVDEDAAEPILERLQNWTASPVTPTAADAEGAAADEAVSSDGQNSPPPTATAGTSEPGPGTAETQPPALDPASCEPSEVPWARP